MKQNKEGQVLGEGRMVLNRAGVHFHADVHSNDVMSERFPIAIAGLNSKAGSGGFRLLLS